MNAFNAVAPVFILLALGIWVRHKRWLSAASVSQLNWLLYWICLPALLFYKTSTAEIQLSKTLFTFAALAFGSLSTLLVSNLMSRMLALKPTGGTAFMQAGFRGNLAFVGLPIALLYGEASGVEVGGLEAQIYLLLAPSILMYNLLGVWLIQMGVRREHGFVDQSIFIEIVKNPLILSICLGVLFSVSGLHLPIVIERTLSSLSGAVLPFALIGVGASIEVNRLRRFGVAGPLAAIVKVVLNPLFGWLFAKLFGLSNEEIKLLVILMMAPTASSAFILAKQLGSDSDLTAKVILASVVGSFFTYALALAILP